MSLLCHSWFSIYGRFTISKIMTSHHFLCPTSNSPCMCNRPFPWCLQKTMYRKHTFVACMTCNCIASNLFHPKQTAFSSCNVLKSEQWLNLLLLSWQPPSVDRYPALHQSLNAPHQPSETSVLYKAGVFAFRIRIYGTTIHNTSTYMNALEIHCELLKGD